MRKYKIIILVLLIIIITTSAFLHYSKGGTSEFTLILPCKISNEGYVSVIDFDAKIENLEVVKSIGNIDLQIHNGKLIVGCVENNSNTVLANRDQFSMFDSPFYITAATIKFEVRNKDIDKFIKSVNKHYNSPEINNYDIDTKAIDIVVHEPFTGIGTKQMFVYKDFEKTINILNNDLDVYIKESEKKFLDENDDIVRFTEELVKNYETIDDKASAIANWVFKNTEFDWGFGDAIYEFFNNESNEDMYSVSIKNAWENKKTVCKGRAFLIKQMLNIAKVESEVLYGYILEKDVGHAIVAYYNDEGERCLINDALEDGYTFCENSYIDLFNML